MGDVRVNDVTDISAAREIAARLAAITDIYDVRLMKTSAEIVNLPADNPFLAYQLESESAVEYEPGTESFVVRGTYRVFISSGATAEALAGPEHHGSPVANIEFEQAALFVMNMPDSADPPKPEELNAYAVSTGQFTLYPYVREYIADLTMRLGLPALTVGVLKMPAQSEEEVK
jgi:hypothetical protein